MLASAPAVSEHARCVERDTVYDLASLTKVLATTTLWALAVGEGRASLDTPVPAPWSRACPGATLADLLAHRGGLCAHREFFVGRALGDREGLMAALCATPAACPAGARTIYSDLGFMILGAWLERQYDRTLDDLFDNRVAWPLGLHEGAEGVPRLGFHRLRPDGARGPADRQRGRVAPTEVYDDAYYAGAEEAAPSHLPLRRAQGYAHYEVHDDNAYVMAGVAGHAGLFGDAEGVLALAHAWLRARLPGLEEARRDRFWTAHPAREGGGTRRLGWDGISPDGAGVTGDALAADALGHTGFTGTSAYIERGAAADGSEDAIYVLLTNRVHPTRQQPEKIKALRRDFHRLAARLVGRG
jgi:CubicO group peptidase (beta-lactamase class C family)